MRQPNKPLLSLSVNANDGRRTGWEAHPTNKKRASRRKADPLKGERDSYTFRSTVGGCHILLLHGESSVIADRALQNSCVAATFAYSDPPSMTSRPARVPRARNTVGSMPSEKNATPPSARAAFTPPG